MIVLDTHIWVWWVSAPDELTDSIRRTIIAHEPTGLLVSAISCWEIAKKVSMGKMELDRTIDEWMGTALQYPGVQLAPLSPEIVIESTRLPGDFHKDPADQLIVATSRVLQCPLLTADEKILAYQHVKFATA